MCQLFCVECFVGGDEGAEEEEEEEEDEDPNCTQDLSGRFGATDNQVLSHLMHVWTSVRI